VTPATIAEARADLDARRVSPVELVDEVLDAIEGGCELNAYIHVDADGARAAAREAEAAPAAAAAAPLAGIPICVKDVIDVAGMPTTAGAAGWARHPSEDAPAVARLRAAGAIVIGKGNTNEFAFGIDGQNPHCGDCHNPRDPGRMSGGSTSGPAAATGAGQALAGVGTDTSGSLRVPASLCGLVSIRPTHGLVPTEGVVPLAWSYDTVGPIARSVEDVATLLGVLSDGASGALEQFNGLAGVRIGLLEQFLDEGCSRAIAGALRDAAGAWEAAGAGVAPAEMPRLEHTTPLHQAIQFSEAAAAHRPWFAAQRDRYSPGVRERIEVGGALPAKDYLLAQRARALIRNETAALMESFDVLVGPTAPVIAPPLGAEEVDVDGASFPLRPALLRFTVPLTQPGGPVVAVPLGESDGMPFGIQILGRPRSEGRLLGLARELQRAAGAPGG
jgi:aspartyl-tRNA(Asn)/glutamyl-tRNA(Gln) amidotransferase subunit A